MKLMKKVMVRQLLSFFVLFAVATLLRGWFKPEYIFFWLGGLVGIVLPDVDHLIYIYLTKPHELTSQRATSLLSQRKVWKAFDLLAMTRTERKNLIFHSGMFQLAMFAFAFFVITSTPNLFGRGLVLAFLLHLSIDQAIDVSGMGSLAHWFENIKLELDKKQATLLVAVQLIVLGMFALFF